MSAGPTSLAIDTSALVAIVHGEADADILMACLSHAGRTLLPASCYLESCMVLSRRSDGRDDLDRLLHGFSIAFIPLDEPVARLAADAFARYGRGTGHRAALNFGDCISYATARHLDVPLLFKGDDFRHTDVKAAL